MNLRFSHSELIFIEIGYVIIIIFMQENGLCEYISTIYSGKAKRKDLCFFKKQSTINY